MIRWAILLLLLAGAPIAEAKTVKVRLRDKPVIDVSAFQRVGVVEFEGIDERMNLNLQIAAQIKKDLTREKTFESVRLIPLKVFLKAVAETSAKGLNESEAEYWKAICSALEVELLLFGSYQYSAEYRPGYVRQQVLDPSTGFLYYQEVYKKMIGYQLNMTLDVIDGLAGKRLDHVRRKSETIVEGGQNTSNPTAFLRIMDRLYKPVHHKMFPPAVPKKFTLLD